MYNLYTIYSSFSAAKIVIFSQLTMGLNGKLMQTL